MIPGINLLNVAMGLIGSQTVEFYKFLGDETLPNGIRRQSFAEPITIDDGSVQAIDKSTYRERGLNLARDYVSWFVSHPVLTLDRDYDGDEFVYDGIRYKVDGCVPWNSQDGWCEILGWEVKNNDKQ